MRSALLLALVLLAPLALAAAAAPQPVAEPPWWETTMLDLDRDGLDDALAALLPDAPLDQPLRVLVAYAAMPGPSERASLEAAGGRVVKGYAHFPILVVDALPAAVPGLRDARGVVLVEMNDRVVTLLRESAPLIGAPQAWERYGATGRGITIAILDDGAFEQHPDFEGKVAGNFDAASPGGGTVGVMTPASEEGHGTHVAGIAVGAGEESDGRYRGIAPEARFANVKVFLRANQTSSEYVLDGLDWTLTNAERLNIRVASMSLGGRPSDGTDAISRAASIAVDKGLVIVAAAGNAGGERTIASPGAAEKVITVGAVDKRKQPAPYSSRGPTLDGRVKPDLAAPGSVITSTVPPVTGGGVGGFFSPQREIFYGQLSGTSMAAPHVSGTVALMLEVNPSLTPIDVKRILLVTAQDLGEPGRDNVTGYGFLNAVAAVQVAKDPELLQQPRFQSVLATIPDPPPEPLFARLAYDAERILGSPALVASGLVGLAAAGLLVVGAMSMRRRGPGDPPP